MEAGPKGAALRQYLERGVDGVRLVNISPIARDFPEKGKKVDLRRSHLAWDPQEGKILLLRNGDPTRHRILLIAPHPDDAEIAAFGLYSHRDSYIVTLTAGESGDNEYTVFYPVPERDAAYVMKGRLRVLDSITVPLIGGIPPSRAINLGYFDNTLQEMYRSPDREQEPRDFSTRESNVFRRHNLKDPGEEVSRKPTWKNMVEDLAKILRNVKPDIIVAPHPLLEEHPDHQYAYIALADALGQTDFKEGRFFLYTNHLVWSKYVPFGPLDGMVSLPPGFGEVPLKGVYSHPVSPALRVEKRFTLDAMHDLQPLTPSDTFEFRDLAADFRDRT